MHIIGWILFGLVVGIVAKFLMPGRDPGGFVITALLGIVGALVGGFLGRAMGWYREGDPVGFFMAVIGSIIVLAVYRFTIGRTAQVTRSRARSAQSCRLSDRPAGRRASER
jgi:uncharacterized membrane protein YeaQ/YmgE (transglycosylase-associated protein family)